MRLHELSPEQQRIFLVLARELVAADGRLVLDEVERLDLLYREMQIPAADGGEPAAAGDLNLFFPDDKSRTLVVLNLLLLAHGDGRLDENERAVARRVADDLLIGQPALAEMESWADRHTRLMRDADALWEGAGSRPTQ